MPGEKRQACDSDSLYVDRRGIDNGLGFRLFRAFRVSKVQGWGLRLRVCCDATRNMRCTSCKGMPNESRLARCCHGLTVSGHLTHSPTPRRLRRQSHPNLLLLGFRPKLSQLGRSWSSTRIHVSLVGLRRRPPTIGGRPMPGV